MFVSQNLWDKLFKRINGKIYADCTDILQPYWQFKPVQRKEKIGRLNGLNVWQTEYGKFISEKFSSILINVEDILNFSGSIWNARFIFEDYDLGYYLWQNSQDIWTNTPDELKERSICLINQNEEKIYIARRDNKLYGYVGYTLCYCCSKGNLKQSYFCSRKANFIYKVKQRYGDLFKFIITNCGYLDWSSFKREYRYFKSKTLASLLDRIMLVNEINEMNVKQAGWIMFSKCLSKEPEGEKIEGDFLVSIIYDKKYNAYYVGYKRRQICILREQFIAGFPTELKKDIDFTTVRVDDKRIIDCLKFCPEYLTVKLNKIPYFKWAVEKLFEQLSKERKN